MLMSFSELTSSPNPLSSLLWRPQPCHAAEEHQGGILGWDPVWEGGGGKWLAVGPVAWVKEQHVPSILAQTLIWLFKVKCSGFHLLSAIYLPAYHGDDATMHGTEERIAYSWGWTRWKSTSRGRGACSEWKASCASGCGQSMPVSVKQSQLENVT